MTLILQTVAAVAMVLFLCAMLLKVGVPWFVVALIAPIGGYFVWRWESAERDDEPRWISAFSFLKDLKDIGKYVNQIF